MDLKEQYDKLLRYCYMKTKDSFLAEDIVQETFLKFWQVHSYEDTGREMAYLYTIARNLCMDEFRRKPLDNIENYQNYQGYLNYQGYQSYQDYKDHPELRACSGKEPENVIEGIAIETALDQLPDELREIVVMRYVSEMSSADIGKVLGISRFSVNRRLKEGLAILKKELGGER